ncbi:hypothetical protein DOTSEDRAFT_27762 [Dothistroma septosporum NZE10]|uniref:Uncharacterized protein n=1 Tax=Dothistroma septosporum (strain NZE10 / CBS 128990) TaxID=675120 RepID=N1PCQ0_DOTSN|nr:hypothetical protein DOTSEDRAFT_27762 [Dothistroma septosporum NZE10]
MSNPEIVYKGISDSYSIFYVEILIPDGAGNGEAYTLLTSLITALYEKSPKVLLREVDSLPYGAPRAFVVGIPERGNWPLDQAEGKWKEVIVRRVWPTGGEGGEDGQ